MLDGAVNPVNIIWATHWYNNPFQFQQLFTEFPIFNKTELKFKIKFCLVNSNKLAENETMIFSNSVCQMAPSTLGL